MNAFLSIAGAAINRVGDYLDEHVIRYNYPQKNFVRASYEQTMETDWTPFRLKNTKRQECEVIERFAQKMLREFGDKLSDSQRITFTECTHNNNQFEKLDKLQLKQALYNIRSKLVQIIKVVPDSDLEKLQHDLQKDYESGAITHIVGLAKLHRRIDYLQSGQALDKLDTIQSNVTLNQYTRIELIWSYINHLKAFNDPETAERLFPLLIDSEYEKQAGEIVIETYRNLGMWNHALSFSSVGLKGRVSPLQLEKIMDRILYETKLDRTLAELSQYENMKIAALKIIIVQINSINSRDSVYSYPLSYDPVKSIKAISAFAQTIQSSEKAEIFQMIINYMFDCGLINKELASTFCDALSQVNKTWDLYLKVLSDSFDLIINHDLNEGLIIFEKFKENIPLGDQDRLNRLAAMQAIIVSQCSKKIG